MWASLSVRVVHVEGQTDFGVTRLVEALFWQYLDLRHEALGSGDRPLVERGDARGEGIDEAVEIDFPSMTDSRCRKYSLRILCCARP
jgi:hypothetical protein